MSRKIIVNVPENDHPLSELARTYLHEVNKLEPYIDKIKDEIKQRPSPDKLAKLETRLRLLRQERYEMLEVACHLVKLVSPPPESPSLLARSRDAS